MSHLVLRVDCHCEGFDRRHVQPVDLFDVLVCVFNAAHSSLERKVQNEKQRNDDTDVAQVDRPIEPNEEERHGCSTEIVQRKPHEVVCPYLYWVQVSLEGDYEGDQPTVEREVRQRE